MKKGVNIWRDENGIPHVDTDNVADMFWGQGYAHAKDRGMQMLLMRILGQGRAAELLSGDDETLKVDMFFRKMNWHGNLENNVEALGDSAKQYLNAYCDGANAVLLKKCPWEFKLMGYSPEPWTPDDSLMISRMVGYLTLAQSQAEVERLLVEFVQADVSMEKLEDLFPGILGGLDIDLIKKVKLEERVVLPSTLWDVAVPRMMASNNWAIAGSRTASGKPIVAGDPHLEVDRLPNIWAELVLKTNDRYMVGASMPGAPGILIGRTPDLAWAVTYSFLDGVDSWVEKCDKGKYYSEDGDQWIPFNQRQEVIKRKKKSPEVVTFYENQHGVLDGDPNKEGLYLATRWSASESGATSMTSLFRLWDMKTVDEGMDVIGQVETGWNFVFAAPNGDIGYQMTGLVPRRREGISGFVPLPGWKKENDWQGYLDHTELPRVKNPDKGYFATANNDLNKYGTASPINIAMGAYRADRIGQLIELKDNITVADICEMHFDVYSLQAEYFMEILRPLLPDTPNGDILRSWDLNYDLESKGAFLFEEFYKELYLEVFGRTGFGDGVVEFLREETGVFIDFYDNFDKVLLSEDSPWFEGRTREEVFQEVAANALDVETKTWHDVQQFMMSNILFGNKLPAIFGFDKGPIPAIGNRATVHQGQIYRSGGRDTTFMPGLRTATDLASDDYFSVIIGGPSDRRFSKWYTSDVENWLNGNYKLLSLDPGQKKFKF